MKRLIPLATLILSISMISCGGGNQQKSPEQEEEKPVKINTKQAKEAGAEDKLLTKAKRYFRPLEEPASFDRPVAKLGKALYYETAMSISGDMSCNSCHLLDDFGVDNEPTSPGHDGTLGERNSPTVYNAYLNIAQFWDGRAEDLTEQAKGPVINPIEMGMPDKETAVESIKKTGKYDEQFAEAFPDEKEKITYHNIATAIAEFEKTLGTPAPIDDYLNGDTDALTDQQKRGLEVFINSGCITCHTGPGFGGDKYQKFGLINGPYWEYTGSEHKDEGVGALEGKENMKYFFKVPILRNVTKTAPYFHDGSVEKLSKAVRIMAKTQQDRDLTDQQVNDIIAFLESLTGEIPGYALQNDKMASL